MIRYALICDHDHGFEAWFGSSADYDDQAARGLVECPVCASTAVTKQIMAPSVAGTKKTAIAADMAAKMQTMMTEAAREVRAHVEHGESAQRGDVEPVSVGTHPQPVRLDSRQSLPDHPGIRRIGEVDRAEKTGHQARRPVRATVGGEAALVRRDRQWHRRIRAGPGIEQPRMGAIGDVVHR